MAANAAAPYPPPQNTRQHQGHGHRGYRHRPARPDQHGLQHGMPVKAGHYLGVDRRVHPAGFHPVPEPHSLYRQNQYADNHNCPGRGTRGGRQQWSRG
jgi:hypothetical protein